MGNHGNVISGIYFPLCADNLFLFQSQGNWVGRCKKESNINGSRRQWKGKEEETEITIVETAKRGGEINRAGTVKSAEYR